MSIKSKFFYKWGENAFKDNNPELALTMFDKAINADPKELKAYIGKYSVFARTGRPIEALKVLDQVVVASPENVKDIEELRQPLIKYIDDIKTGKDVAVEYCNKGIVLLNQFQQPEEAIKMFDKAIEIDSRFTEAYANKGAALGKLGRIEEAMTMADKALEINPQYARAYYNKGICLNMLGKQEEARKMLYRAYEIDPELAKL